MIESCVRVASARSSASSAALPPPGSSPCAAPPHASSSAASRQHARIVDLRALNDSWKRSERPNVAPVCRAPADLGVARAAYTGARRIRRLMYHISLACSICHAYCASVTWGAVNSRCVNPLPACRCGAARPSREAYPRSAPGFRGVQCSQFRLAEGRLLPAATGGLSRPRRLRWVACWARACTACARVTRASVGGRPLLSAICPA